MALIMYKHKFKTLCKLTFLALPAICSIINCTTKSEKNLKNELPPRNTKVAELENWNINNVKSKSTDSLWYYLLYKEGGCLTGGQYISKGKFGGEGCVMSKSENWIEFFNRDTTKLTNFLLQKISPDTLRTKIHTCPFFMATEGEVAIYALQKLHNFNWFDFPEFKEYSNKKPTGATENTQRWLQNIIEIPHKRLELINCWKNKASR